MPNSASAIFTKQYLPSTALITVLSNDMAQILELTQPISAMTNKNQCESDYKKTDRIKFMENRNIGPLKQEEAKNAVPLNKPVGIWVKKWVDYSSKYGFGYLLTSGLTGVFSNDSTKVILNLDDQLASK